ncbi:MAG: AAA family ATPase [Candidatus Acidiferrales bacterium]
MTANAVDRKRAACVYVLAGTNGAGKSSVGGAMFRESGVEYFDPDEAALRLRSANPGMTQEEANSAAWHQGRRLLERAISERLDFAMETTLGGRTIAGLLEQAISEKIEVRMSYVGLASPELHIARVRSRVAAGGHDIPEAKIRERYDKSRINLLDLMPSLTELWLYDNSAEGDPRRGAAPKPRLLLHMKRGKIVESCDLRTTPEWARPILALAMRLSR